MTQYASEVLSSLADQIVNVKQPSLSALLDRTDLDPRLAADLGLEEYSIPDLDAVASNAQRRDALFSIDRKIKELVAKLQQNQSLMNKHDYQLCILQANQLSMLNYQKLTLLMQQSEGALLQGSDTEDEYESLGSAGARSMLEVQGGFLGGRHLLP